MVELEIDLTNCFGIQHLKKKFDFSPSKNKAYAIYAPNGLMKTSFSKTFDKLSKGENPKEERYNRPARFEVKEDGTDLNKDVIYVLHSEIDISTDSPAITDILVNRRQKQRYDALLLDLDKLKNKLITSLSKQSKLKKTEIVSSILRDWNESDFPTCIEKILGSSSQNDLSSFEYSTIFDPKAVAVLESPEFLLNSKEFTDKYDELFVKAGSIYKKGVFNPVKADTSFSTLDKQGFFAGGHKVHLNGQAESIDKDTLYKTLESIHSEIDGSEELKKLRTNLAKNAQTQALVQLIENLSPTEIDFLLESLKPENQQEFRRNLWAFYIQQNADAQAYIESFLLSKPELESIEAGANQSVPAWTSAIERFNDRFIDMPFTLAIQNHSDAVLGKAPPRLEFIFKDGDDEASYKRSEIKTLSQGEKRALYLLNFIFDVEARKLASQKTLFIIDDVADSFDYKNKHAITQYLADLTKTDYFYQIILTHNFDFFRALANGFVHRDRCLMTNRNNSTLTLSKAEGIQNIFINKWKGEVDSNEIVCCASVPFTRNLIEYTKGEGDSDYRTLTSLLHWKRDTHQITVGEYFDIYNRLFGTSHAATSQQVFKDLLFTKASDICQSNSHDGLNLEDKVLLSIAVRMKAEMFITDQLRRFKNQADYWSSNKTFGKLLGEYSSEALADPSALSSLEKVSVTVSSNIHLNSFMYEPILDLSIEHLIALHSEIEAL